MDLHITLSVKVDEATWAGEYGLTPDEARADAPDHIAELVLDAVRERAKLLGTFEVTHHSVVDQASTVAGQVVPAPKLADRLPAADSRWYSTADPRVLVARWGPDNWKTLVEFDDGWDVVGSWHLTKEAAIAAAPGVVFIHFAAAASV